MKKVIICFLILSFIVVNADDKKPNSSPKISENPLPGGYLLQKVDQPDIQKKAKQALEMLQSKETNYKLIKVHKAATQVVAGTNYFFLLELSTPKKANSFWQIYVYEGFDGKLELVKKVQIVAKEKKKVVKRDKASLLDKWNAPKKFERTAQNIQIIFMNARSWAISRRVEVHVIFFVEKSTYDLPKRFPDEKARKIEGKKGTIHDHAVDGSAHGKTELAENVTIDRKGTFVLIFHVDGSMRFHDPKNPKAKDNSITLRYKNTELVRRYPFSFATGRLHIK